MIPIGSYLRVLSALVVALSVLSSRILGFKVLLAGFQGLAA